MDVSEYVEALEALNECRDALLMVEPLTWTTAIQGWQERASITRDLADRVADDKAAEGHAEFEDRALWKPTSCRRKEELCDGEPSTEAPPALRPALAGAPPDHGARHPPPAGVELRRPSQVCCEVVPDASWGGPLDSAVLSLLPARVPSLRLYGPGAR